MIESICIYGHSVLRAKAQELPLDYPCLDVLLSNLFETMHYAQGVGIAAPQIGLGFRVFVVDVASMCGLGVMDNTKFTRLKKVFINPTITEKSIENVIMPEGCLSIPNINEKIDRPSKICVQYIDEDRRLIERECYEGLAARVIQHEFDHLEGILFIDHVKGLRRQMIRSKLDKMMNRKAK